MSDGGPVLFYQDMKSVPEQSKWPALDFLRKKFKIGQFDKEFGRKALVQKSGHYRVKYTGLKKYRGKFLKDLYITLIDLKWRYALAILFNAYLVTFFFFGVMWYWLMADHGDFENVHNPDWEPCVSSVRSFSDAILFSIETQTTIGYGVAYPNTDCGGALPLLFIQITLGIFLENLLLGFIFVKFAQPKKRRNTLMFSKNACINQEDGTLCLQVRVGDIRKSHLVDAKVHGVLVSRRLTDEGHLYPLYLRNIQFQANGMNDRIILMWPMILTHKITHESPLWKIKPADLSAENYELILFIEGTIETTGEFCQARSSYLPHEILWGHRFDRIEDFDAGNGCWQIDFTGFNDVVYCSNIRHSAKELDDFRRKQRRGQSSTRRRRSVAMPPSPRLYRSVSYDLPPDYPSAISSTEFQKVQAHSIDIAMINSRSRSNEFITTSNRRNEKTQIKDEKSDKSSSPAKTVPSSDDEYKDTVSQRIDLPLVKARSRSRELPKVEDKCTEINEISEGYLPLIDAGLVDINPEDSDNQNCSESDKTISPAKSLLSSSDEDDYKDMNITSSKN